MAGRRVNLPAADDLFRPTASKAPARSPRATPSDDADERKGTDGAVSGRGRHDEKRTVYVTSDELSYREHARRAMRREHGGVVDRGRSGRAALAPILAAFNPPGANRALGRSLSEA